MPTVNDLDSPTPEEQQATSQAFSAYYRLGDTFSYTAPNINGIAPNPSSVSYTLGATVPENTRIFTYAATDTAIPTNPTPSGTDTTAGDGTSSGASTGGLAETGASVSVIVMGIVIVIMSGFGVLVVRKYSPARNL